MKAFLGIARVVVWLVDAICFIAMVALAFAFFLLMFGASPTAPFSRFVYMVAKPFMRPFTGVFPGQFFQWPTGTAGYVSLGIVVAFFVYAIISAIVSWIYSGLSGSYYRRQAQDSLARDVAAISAASAAAAASQAQVAQAQAAQAQAAAQAAATAQAAQYPVAAAPAPVPPDVTPVAPPAAPPAAPEPFAPPEVQPPAPGGPA
jgi:uncharacterized protein YggT (Ycf19 family)